MGHNYMSHNCVGHNYARLLVRATRVGTGRGAPDCVAWRGPCAELVHGVRAAAGFPGNLHLFLFTNFLEHADGERRGPMSI